MRTKYFFVRSSQAFWLSHTDESGAGQNTCMWIYTYKKAYKFNILFAEASSYYNGQRV